MSARTAKNPPAARGRRPFSRHPAIGRIQLHSSRSPTSGSAQSQNSFGSRLKRSLKLYRSVDGGLNGYGCVASRVSNYRTLEVPKCEKNHTWRTLFYPICPVDASASQSVSLYWSRRG